MVSQTEELGQLLQEAQTELTTALEGITEEELRTPPKEGEWSVAQVLGHVAEMQPFWVRKALLMATLENPNIARSPEEAQQRLRAVAETERMPWPELQRRVEEAGSQAVTLVRRLREKDLRRLGTRGDGSVITIQQLVERTVAEHVQEHARQVRATRRAASGQ